MSLNVPSTGPIQLSTGSATGNPRNKVALKPGHSLMDWIRLGKSGQDLTGVKGQKLQVTTEELSKHSKDDDAWIAIRGYVYNVTPYMPYHPGGIPELWRGIGQDATQTFDEVHNWVNFQSMLNPCLVGRLVDKPVNKPVTKVKSDVIKTSLILPDVNSLSMIPPPVLNLPPPIGLPKPRYEWVQTDSTVTIVVYTKYHGFSHEHVEIDRPGSNHIIIRLYIKQHTYLINLALENELANDYKVSVSANIGKVEILCSKCIPGTLWLQLGTPCDQHDTWLQTHLLESPYRACSVMSVSMVSHDTQLYTLQTPDGCRLCVPLAGHIRLCANIQGIEICKSYTPVPSDISTSNTTHNDGKHIYLMIKIYPDGALTPHINQLQIGDVIEVSSAVDVLGGDQFTQYTHVILCAAGTGFTPMASLIHHLLHSQVDHHRKICLMFYNKEEKDILWRDQLDSLQKQFVNFQCKYILSASQSWQGMTGRISQDHIKQLLPPPSDVVKPLFCVCGPTPFTEQAVRLATEFGYTKDMIKAFIG